MTKAVWNVNVICVLALLGFSGCGDSRTAGAPGLTSLVSFSDEAAGDNCTDGGTKLETGLDTDGNGQLDSSEVTSVNFICTSDVGDKGDKGLSSLIDLSDIPQGDVRCPAGGVQIDVGIDLDADGQLESPDNGSGQDEVTDTRVICHPGTCGNGKIDGGEECDDGNDVDDDFCSNACKYCTAGDDQLLTSNSCYLFFKASVEWPVAHEACVSKGGHLLKIDDDAENRTVANWKCFSWLALTDQHREGSLRSAVGTNTDGSLQLVAAAYINLWERSPNDATRDCAIGPRPLSGWTEPGTWEMAECDGSLVADYVCEQEF